MLTERTRSCNPQMGERPWRDLIVLTEVEASIEKLAVSDLIKLTDGIQPKVLEAAVTVACKIGRAAGRGKRIGAIFMLGDSLKVLEGSKQLVLNPFQGHDKARRIHKRTCLWRHPQNPFHLKLKRLLPETSVFLMPA